MKMIPTGADGSALTSSDVFQAHMTQAFLHWGFSFDENDVAVLLLTGKDCAEIAAIRSQNEDEIEAIAAAIGEKSGAGDAWELAFHLVRDLVGEPLTAQPAEWVS